MRTFLITFMSQTAAYRFRKIARDNGVAVAILQTPREISHGGCSYAARCTRNDAKKMISLCRKYGVEYSRVFGEYVDTSGRRVYEEGI